MPYTTRKRKAPLTKEILDLANKTQLVGVAFLPSISCPHSNRGSCGLAVVRPIVSEPAPTFRPFVWAYHARMHTPLSLPSSLPPYTHAAIT